MNSGNLAVNASLGKGAAALGEYWYVGVILSLLGALASTAAYMLQRWSHQRNSALPTQKQLPPYKQWPNVLGVILLGLEAVLEALSLNFAAESLIASLASVSVVLNLVLAPRLLGEKMQKGDFMITFLVIIGTSVCVVFSSHSDDEYTWADLYRMFFQQQFILYIFGLSLVSAVLFGLANQWHLNLKFWLRRIFARDSFFWTAEFAVRAKRVALPTAAAICAGFMAMLGKATVSLISDLFAGHNEFAYFGAWMMPLACVCFLLFQIIFLNESLRIYSALSIVPFYETMNSIFGIINGAVFYRDFDHVSSTQAVFFSLGMLINVAALVMLTQRPVVGGAAMEQEMEMANSSSQRHDSRFSIVDIDEELGDVDEFPTPGEQQNEEAEEMCSSPGEAQSQGTPLMR